jgi:hypothetical protein
MENNGKGIFYGVIGVATLIVAIIGATFAYFTASASNDNTITGTAAQAGLNLSVTLASTDATGTMVPQLGTAIQKAVTGTNSKSCIDGNGNTVCKVYTITISNTGSSATVLYGQLGFAYTDGSFADLKWGLGKTATDTTDLAATASVTTPTQGNFVNGVHLQAAGEDGASATYYVVVWIEETNAAQNETDAGTFTGTVSFNSAAGSGVTSTFTA